MMMANITFLLYNAFIFLFVLPPKSCEVVIIVFIAQMRKFKIMQFK